ncbi:MAG: CapA family protein [Hyphomicrobium sp.]
MAVSRLRISHRAQTASLAGALALAAAMPTAAGETFVFAKGCERGEKVVIAAVGDLLFHASLQRTALAKGGRYLDFWSPVQPVIAAADIAYGNLEGPAAYGVDGRGRARTDPGRRLDGLVYGPDRPVLTELVFNYHPSVVSDIKESGFDIVSTANNHSADRGALGIDRTIEALEREKLPFTGTRRGDVVPGRWSTVTEAKGVRVAWLACTYSSNGIPTKGQVLECYKNRDVVMGELAALAADPTIDAVILTPHWGIEKSHVPLRSDREYARAAVEAGATAIVGTHAHVLQPWEKVTATDGREALVIYSTGNFISNQPWEPTRHGVIALLELTKAAGSKAVLSAVGHIPTRVDRETKGHRVNAVAGRASAQLPAGNRVSMQKPREFPRSCPAVVATTAEGDVRSAPSASPVKP